MPPASSNPAAQPLHLDFETAWGRLRDANPSTNEQLVEAGSTEAFGTVAIGLPEIMGIWRSALA